MRKFGKRKWKEVFRYGVSSRKDDVFYRIKRLFGNCESSRLDEMGKVELLVWSKVSSIMEW
ncbi:MAG: hypothetical protein ACK4F9_04870 [Brevinematia bacterium]